MTSVVCPFSSRFSKSARISANTFLLLAAFTFGIRMQSQDAPAVHVGTGTFSGVPDDWTHHHLIFTDPGTEQDAVKNGTHERWLKVVNDPRYVLQQMKRGQSIQGPAAQDVEMRRRLLGVPVPPGDGDQPGNPGFTSPDRVGGPISRGPGGFRNPKPLPAPNNSALQRDWSMNVGGSSATKTITIATPLSAGNISGTSTLTVGGVTFNASAPTAASTTGTFTGNPTAAQNVTIGGAVVLTPSLSTAATRTGTFSSSPLTSSAITVVNGANTLTLKTNGTGATATGTFSGAGLTVGQQISLKSGSNPAITFTAAAAGTATATFTGDPGGGDTITIGGTVYTWHGSSGGCNGVTNCIIHGGTTTQDAQNLEAAINNNAGQCGFTNGGSCIFGIVGANASVTATQATNVVTVTNITAGTVAWSRTGTAITLAPATIPAGGTNACSSTSAGTFLINATLNTEASNFATAISSTSCQTTFPIGVTAAAVGAVVTITDTTPGTFNTLSNLTDTSANFAWSGPVAGTNGSNTCTTSTTGTFATDSNTTNLATNLAAAISACPTGTGVTAASATNNVTLTASAWGTGGNSISLTSTSGFYTWAGGTLTGGANGLNTGTNFQIDNVVADNATNLAAAIARNGGGVGVTATSAAGVVTISASTPGTSANGITVAETLANFSWANGTLTGGLNGTADATHFPYWTGSTYVTNSQLATNIATAIAANSTANAVVTAAANSPASGNVTFTAVAAGSGGNSDTVAVAAFSAVSGTGTFAGGAAGGKAGQMPAKYSFTDSTVTAANCTSDFIVYPTGGAGSASQATITAYNNMYKTTCSGNVPSIFWAYNTGGTANLSPVLSSDGTQVAYVQTVAGTASLVMLKMANSGGSVVAPTLATVANYHTCTAPCYTTVSLGAGDTNSAPFYDYANDVVYVGDNSGKLHKIQYVFFAGPSSAGPVEAASWPVTVTATAGLGVLTSPVYDSTSDNVFIGEGYTTGNNPSMMEVNATTRTVTQSHAGSGGTGLGSAYLDTPIVDSSAAKVYAFIGDDGNSGFNCGGFFVPCSAVYQLPIGSSFSTFTPTEAYVGQGSTSGVEYAGTFDNTYFTSAVATSPTGTLYVCGNTSGNPTLYAIAIAGNSMGSGAATTETALTSATATCSPITEVANGTHDWIFLSVTNDGNKIASGTGKCSGTGAAGACVYSFDVGSGGSKTIPADGILASGGASAITIDNTSSTTGASQIYYTTLSSQACGGNAASQGAGTGGCAVQASQAALQ